MSIQPYLDYNDELYDVYRQLNLQSIDDFHAEKDHRWDAPNFMSFFTNITRGVNRVNTFDESDFKIYDEFVLLSGDIKFCAGMLNYLYPHITTRHNELSSTLIDRRYIMHINFGYQSIYQFWDRIGDLLWHFFYTGLDKNAVYTGRVLSNISNAFKETANYIALKTLYEKFKEFFDIQHEVVHSFTLGTEIYWQRNASYGDERKQQELLDKMATYKDAITDSLPQCIEALVLTLNLIDEIKAQQE